MLILMPLGLWTCCFAQCGCSGWRKVGFGVGNGLLALLERRSSSSSNPPSLRTPSPLRAITQFVLDTALSVSQSTDYRLVCRPRSS